MMNDAIFIAKTLRRIDKAENYLTYLSNDYLPDLAKQIGKSFKLARRGHRGLLLASVGLAVIAYTHNKQIKELEKQNEDLKEHLAALEDRLDNHIDPEWKTPGFDDEDE